MRQTLDAIAALPQEIAVPALFALEQWRTNHASVYDVAEALAHALHAHGDHALKIADVRQDDALRRALLPLPDNPGLAHALRALVRDDLETGRKLMQALHDHAWNDVSIFLLNVPIVHARAVLMSLLEDRQSQPSGEATTFIRSLAADAHADALLMSFQRMAASHPHVVLGIAALGANDLAGDEPVVAALAENMQMVRSLLFLLRPDIRNRLRAHPALAAALADLPDKETYAPPQSLRSRVGSHKG